MNNLKRIQDAIAAQGLDALLLIDPLNRYYATGFHTSDGAVLITPDRGYYITDSRYMRMIDTRASEYFELHQDCRECKYALCCYGGCRADALATDETDIMGKSMGSCKLFRDGWVERIIEAVKKARPTATSPVLKNPLWSDMA